MALPYLFEFWAMEHQLPPEGDWRAWAILGGRGAGPATPMGTVFLVKMAASALPSSASSYFFDSEWTGAPGGWRPTALPDVMV